MHAPSIIGARMSGIYLCHVCHAPVTFAEYEAHTFACLRIANALTDDDRWQLRYVAIEHMERSAPPADS